MRCCTLSSQRAIEGISAMKKVEENKLWCREFAHTCAHVRVCAWLARLLSWDRDRDSLRDLALAHKSASLAVMCFS